MSEYNIARQNQYDVNAVSPNAVDAADDPPRGNIKVGYKMDGKDPKEWGYTRMNGPGAQPTMGQLSDNLKVWDDEEINWLLLAEEGNAAIITIDFAGQQPSSATAFEININGQLVTCTWNGTFSTFTSTAVPDLGTFIHRNIGATIPITLDAVLP